jgi:hypothetical protein
VFVPQTFKWWQLDAISVSTQYTSIYIAGEEHNLCPKRCRSSCQQLNLNRRDTGYDSPIKLCGEVRDSEAEKWPDVSCAISHKFWNRQMLWIGHKHLDYHSALHKTGKPLCSIGATTQRSNQSSLLPPLLLEQVFWSEALHFRTVVGVADNKEKMVFHHDKINKRIRGL